jgi:hypothetical protein
MPPPSFLENTRQESKLVHCATLGSPLAYVHRLQSKVVTRLTVEISVAVDPEAACYDVSIPHSAPSVQLSLFVAYKFVVK